MSPPFARHMPRFSRQFAIIVSLLVVFSFALFFLPGAVASVSSGVDGISTATLARSVGVAFSEWWRTGAAPLTGGMEEVVKFWQIFHVAKAAVAAILLVLLTMTGAQVWKAYAQATTRARRFGYAVIGVAGAPLTLLVLIILLANVQGSIAPLSSVMGLIPMDGSVAEVTAVREQFAAGSSTPVLDVLVNDFRDYHLVIVFAAPIAAAGVMVADLVLWLRWVGLPRENYLLRRVCLVVAVVTPSVALMLVLIMIVNLSTVLDIAPALAAFFGGQR